MRSREYRLYEHIFEVIMLIMRSISVTLIARNVEKARDILLRSQARACRSAFGQIMKAKQGESKKKENSHGVRAHVHFNHFVYNGGKGARAFKRGLKGCDGRGFAFYF